MTRFPLPSILAAALSVMMIGSLPAMAQASLSDDPHVTEQLVAASVGDAIRKTCPTISARMLVVFNKARALDAYAREKGFTGDQIDDFMSSKTEKARIKAQAQDYLAANGATPGNVEGFCALGQAEIARKSLIGQLLKSGG